MPAGFRPPPYPYERLAGLREVADALAGGVVDCSVGTPGDPVPEVARAALVEAAADAAGYPPSAGTPDLRSAAAAWLGRRFGVEVDPDVELAACVGTKELVASLPHLLHLRDPSRGVVLHPAVAYPTYAMGAALAGLRSVPVPLTSDWHLDLDAIADADADAALVLWVNEPGNPTASAAGEDWFARAVGWAREHGVLLASDECYAEFAPRPTSALRAGTDGVLAVHSVSKRSNLAGGRVGFYAGDADVVSFLREVRKHAGLMVPAPLQAAAAAALADDDHVAAQLDRYRSRRELVLERLAPHGLDHRGGPTAFYLWLACDDDLDGWAVATELARRAGLLVAPGDLYGPGGADHVRLALVQPDERLRLAMDRLGDAS